MNEQEQVLVVPINLINFEGYISVLDDVQMFVDLIDEHGRYESRDEMEKNPEFKQIIPYVVSKNNKGQTFIYTRTIKSGEKRLHSRRSIGVGGHINPIDGNASYSAYLKALRRELDEEIKYNRSSPIQLVGAINDNSDAVGQVHLGLVHLMSVGGSEILPNEPEKMVNCRFVDQDVLISMVDQFESWSQILIESIKNASETAST